MNISGMKGVMARGVRLVWSSTLFGLGGCLNVCDPGTPGDPTLSPCADTDAAASVVEVTDDAPPEDYDTAKEQRLGCKFPEGSYTTQTIGGAVPRGGTLPFNHVVVLMMENRSFDHYFSELGNADVRSSDACFDSKRNAVTQYPETRFCAVGDSNHEWEKVHQQWHRGAMDGFVVTNGDAKEPMGYFGRSALPMLYFLADQFATSDRYFSSLLGPTWPNRYFLFSATAWARTSTPNQHDPQEIQLPPVHSETIFGRMKDAGWSVGLYTDNPFPSVTRLMLPTTFELDEVRTISDFETDAAAGALPELSFLEAVSGGSEQSDDHPEADIRRGQAFIGRIVDAIKQDKTWADTVFFITYDEHGGYYDHVPPPAACEPDDYKPPSYAFDRLGVRVPMLAISKWSKPGYVGKVVADHTSITRFIENRWNLPAMTRRDANAWPLLDLFDFSLDRPFPGGEPVVVAPAVGAPCN